MVESGSQSNLQACDSGNHRSGRGPGPLVCGSHDLVNKIGSSCNTEIWAKGPGSCRSCLASGLGESEGVWYIQGLRHTPRPEAPSWGFPLFQPVVIMLPAPPTKCLPRRPVHFTGRAVSLDRYGPISLWRQDLPREGSRWRKVRTVSVSK